MSRGAIILAAAAYAVANVLLFNLTFGRDAFAIFDRLYLIFCFLVMPVAAMAAVAWAHFRFRRAHWTWSLLGVALVLGASFAHLYVVVEYSASV